VRGPLGAVVRLGVVACFALAAIGAPLPAIAFGVVLWLLVRLERGPS